MVSHVYEFGTAFSESVSIYFTRKPYQYSNSRYVMSLFYMPWIQTFDFYWREGGQGMNIQIIFQAQT